MNSKSENKLNQLLKGEHMAVKAFGDVVSVIDQPELKDELTSLQQRHYENIQTLSSHIASQGETPTQNAGVVGWVSSTAFRISSVLNDNPERALEYLCEGEDQGIKMAQELVEGELDRPSRNLAKKVLDNDRKNLQDLRKTLDKYQNK